MILFTFHLFEPKFDSTPKEFDKMASCGNFVDEILRMVSFGKDLELVNLTQCMEVENEEATAAAAAIVVVIWLWKWW